MGEEKQRGETCQEAVNESKREQRNRKPFEVAKRTETDDAFDDAETIVSANVRLFSKCRYFHISLVFFNQNFPLLPCLAALCSVGRWAAETGEGKGGRRRYAGSGIAWPIMISCVSSGSHAQQPAYSLSSGIFHKCAILCTCQKNCQ